MQTRYDVERAVMDSDLPAVERHILLALCTRMQRGSTEIPARWSPSLTRLTEDTGWNRKTLTRHLPRLEATGWLVRQKRPGKRTLYAITCPADPARDSQPSVVGTLSPETRDSQPPIQREPDNDQEIELVIEEMEKRTGKRITAERAAAARDFILARPRRSDDARSRAGYLRRTIAQDPDPSRFLPTPTPPRFTREKGFDQ